MRALFAVGVLVMALSACTKSNMDDQPKQTEYKEGTLRQAPAGTVSRDDDKRQIAVTQKPRIDSVLLARGRDRYEVFCTPCHDRTGRGNGIVVQRGMPRPPDYHDARLRDAPDQHFFEVITNGYGAMYSYAARIPPGDRWAIVAYIRALQLSRNAKIDDVPDDQRAALYNGKEDAR